MAPPQVVMLYWYFPLFSCNSKGQLCLSISLRSPPPNMSVSPIFQAILYPRFPDFLCVKYTNLSFWLTPLSFHPTKISPARSTGLYRIHGQHLWLHFLRLAWLLLILHRIPLVLAFPSFLPMYHRYHSCYRIPCHPWITSVAAWYGSRCSGDASTGWSPWRKPQEWEGKAGVHWDQRGSLGRPASPRSLVSGHVDQISGSDLIGYVCSGLCTTGTKSLNLSSGCVRYASSEYWNYCQWSIRFCVGLLATFSERHQCDILLWVWCLSIWVISIWKALIFLFHRALDAPLVFESAGWIGRDAILMTGINGIVYILSTIPTFVNLLQFISLSCDQR